MYIFIDRYTWQSLSEWGRRTRGISTLVKLFDNFDNALIGARDDSQHGDSQNEDIFQIDKCPQALGHLGADNEVDKHRYDKSQRCGAQCANEGDEQVQLRHYKGDADCGKDKQLLQLKR